MTFRLNSNRRLRRLWCGAGGLCLVIAAGAIGYAAGVTPPSEVQVVFRHTLPNAPGKTLTAVVVNYPPGGKSKPHHHAGVIFAYVLSGAVRSQVNDEPARVYQAGENFFEDLNAHHRVSEDASETEPARLLAISVADDGATLTTYDQ
jgi:quercetin dioxygenase-like cupin family protein